MMASLTNQANGRRVIQFVDKAGKRRSIRLGKVTKRQAEAIKIKVESLVAASISGHPPTDEVSRWVATLDGTLRERLAGVGLVEPLDESTLQAFVDSYIAGRSDVKESTQVVYKRARRNLIAFFGPDKRLRDINRGDAEDWRIYLVEQGNAENTVRRQCGIAKQFANAAIKKRLITENPFDELTCTVRANPKRFYFVSPEESQAVLDACPDAEWRLMFALARYGGLRVPSEFQQLRWGDVDWAKNRFTVHSPKTEHHDGGESRVVPIFPELEPYLREAFELATEGTEYLITRYRDSAVNLRTTLNKIINRAGLSPWPKLWQNLRSTRETELVEKFPIHVVTAWIGNSPDVAMKHYLQVHEGHYEQAAGALHNPVHALQKAVQNPAESGRTVSQSLQGDRLQVVLDSGFSERVRENARIREMGKVGDTGLEPVTSRV